ncbi:unnamed protein product [Caenorhabditis auriculariae]|uniref:Apple domain-containing protein n=1 Tax=Caenorhabditis auriculariae TaxID=2777116 RepID=A0A8S1H7K4_9PELO|nr:unnamed protein product [Caenorhabditis auriculariae]
MFGLFLISHLFPSVLSQNETTEAPTNERFAKVDGLLYSMRAGYYSVPSFEECLRPCELSTECVAVSFMPYPVWCAQFRYNDTIYFLPSDINSVAFKLSITYSNDGVSTYYHPKLLSDGTWDLNLKPVPASTTRKPKKTKS